MDAAAFRALALDLPEAVEGGHQGHADFRVGGKVFASLGPDQSWAMLKLPPDLQQLLVDNGPDVFEPFAGAWGRQGCTKVQLAPADPILVEEGLAAAWQRTAPPAVRRRHPEVGGD